MCTTCFTEKNATCLLWMGTCGRQSARRIAELGVAEVLAVAAAASSGRFPRRKVRNVVINSSLDGGVGAMAEVRDVADAALAMLRAHA